MIQKVSPLKKNLQSTYHLSLTSALGGSVVGAQATHGLLEVSHGAANELLVLETKLVVDGLEILDRVNLTVNVDNIDLIESTADVEDGIDGTDVGQESVTKSLSGRGALHQTSNIDHSQPGGNLLLGSVVLGEPCWS